MTISPLSPGVFTSEGAMVGSSTLLNSNTLVADLDWNIFEEQVKIASFDQINNFYIKPNLSAPFLSVYYQTFTDPGFWYRLSDDTGPSPTGREQVLTSMNQNFAFIKAQGFNTVFIGINNVDDFPSQHGGGFAYDPINRPRPNFGPLQEIVLRVADSNGLKVIFVICPSQYQCSTDGRADWVGLADQYGSGSNPPGAYDFIHCCFDPTYYYGVQTTTKLQSTLGIPDGNTKSLIGDPRIIGWILRPEWAPDVITPDTHTQTHQYMVNKYFNYFYGFVHANNYNNAFAGSYLIAEGLPDQDMAVKFIKEVKQWFLPNTGVIKPDFIGFQLYGGDANNYPTYDLSNTYNQANALLAAFTTIDNGYPGDYVFPADRVFIGEANAIRLTANADLNLYFQNMYQFVNDTKLAGINLWVSSSLSSTKANSTSNVYILSPSQDWDLFTSNYTSISTSLPANTGLEATNTLPALFFHYHDNTANTWGAPWAYLNGSTVDTQFPNAYGYWNYTGLTMSGQMAIEALSNHTNNKNLLFYASPNPVTYSPGANTTLFWNASKMPWVNQVEVRIGSQSGSAIGNGIPIGNLSISIPDLSSQQYFLIDTTANSNVLLGSLTLFILSS
jgi:hypothetical protein